MDRFSAHFEHEASAKPRGREVVQSRLPASLIDERFDHDSCGVGFVASVDAVSSHSILQQALTALSRLAHRGAVAADGKSSDGVGLMTAVPRRLLLDSTGLRLNKSQELGVGMLFLPEEAVRALAPSLSKA
jgi:glutamate synthase (NADPH/NADH) large chain